MEPSSHRGRNESADGLRGIASMIVTICHFICAFLPELMHKNHPNFPQKENPDSFFILLQSPFLALFYNGHFAVIVFFVLSGLVLTMPYFTDNREALRRRLYGRYLRLNIPVAVSIGVSFFIYKMGWYFNHAAANALDHKKWLASCFPDGISAALAIKSALYDAIVTGDTLLNPPLWTLRIEFLGSIFLLTMYLYIPKRRIVIATVAAAILLDFVYENDAIFFISILAGALLNFIRPNTVWSIVCLILGLYFSAFQLTNYFYDFLPEIHWGRLDFYWLIGALLITVSTLGGAGSSVLKSRFAQFLGRQSFSLYLVHFIVLCSITSGLYLILGKSPLALCANFILYIAVCLLLSVLMTKFIDEPAIHVSRRFANRLIAASSNQSGSRMQNAEM